MPLTPAPRDTAALPVLLPRIDHADRFAAARDVGVHQHQGPELVLVTEGACTCESGVDGVRRSGRSGTLFVFPGGCPHDQRNLTFTRTTFVVFVDQPAQFDATARTILLPDADPVGIWMEQICDCSARAAVAGERVAGALLFACLERLNALERRQQARAALPPGLARALAHLESSQTAPFSAGELARRSGLSVSHMNALFREHLGRSPLHVQQEQRLHRASTLLLGPYARVNEVAAECGYADANYFVRLFTRRFGVSPGVWRKQQANGGGVEPADPYAPPVVVPGE